MKKRLIIGLVLFLLVLSSLSLAQNETDQCTGFSWLKCFLFGDASKRPVAGAAWYDRDGEASAGRTASPQELPGYTYDAETGDFGYNDETYFYDYEGDQWRLRGLFDVPAAVIGDDDSESELMNQLNQIRTEAFSANQPPPPFSYSGNVFNYDADDDRYIVHGNEYYYENDQWYEEIDTWPDSAVEDRGLLNILNGASDETARQRDLRRQQYIPASDVITAPTTAPVAAPAEASPKPAPESLVTVAPPQTRAGSIERQLASVLENLGLTPEIIDALKRDGEYITENGRVYRDENGAIHIVLRNNEEGVINADGQYSGTNLGVLVYSVREISASSPIVQPLIEEKSPEVEPTGSSPITPTPQSLEDTEYIDNLNIQCRRGVANSCALLSVIYNGGIGTTADPTQAQTYADQFAELISEEDRDDLINTWQTGCDGRNAESCALLSVAYNGGIGTDVSAKRAGYYASLYQQYREPPAPAAPTTPSPSPQTFTHTPLDQSFTYTGGETPIITIGESDYYFDSTANNGEGAWRRHNVPFGVGWFDSLYPDSIVGEGDLIEQLNYARAESERAYAESQPSPSSNGGTTGTGEVPAEPSPAEEETPSAGVGAATGAGGAEAPAPPTPEEELAAYQAGLDAQAQQISVNVRQRYIDHSTGSTQMEEIVTPQLDSEMDSILSRNPDEDNEDYIERLREHIQAVNGDEDTNNDIQNSELVLGKLDALEELQDQADTLYWQGSWLENMVMPERKDGESEEDFKDRRTAYAIFFEGQYIGEVVSGVAQFAQSLGSYRALSNLLFEDVTQDWNDWADKTFAEEWTDTPGVVARDICEYDEEKSRELAGQSTAFVHTRSGTYQFVGSIQAEKSELTSPILCERNPNPDEEEYVCAPGFICKEDLFCYEDEDDEVPVQGNFYKITWGVAAPQDEKFTPYIDENGKAVKFNLQLQGVTTKWIFSSPGIAPDSVLALSNSESDGGTIAKYVKEQYSRVCIIFNSQYRVIDSGGEPVDKICANFIITEKGRVEYESSDRSSEPARSTTSAQVSMNI